MHRLLAAFCLLSGVASTAEAGTFRQQQLAVPRVRDAVAAKAAVVRSLFVSKGLPYPPRGVFLRVFKLDRSFELWGQATDGTWRLVKEYAICASSGELGPKRHEGDGQVPEGFYEIGVFNPHSEFHLSLGVSYPNASDRIRGRPGPLGGAIMIHGNCVTIGCVPITDTMIDEVYIAAMDARDAGQSTIEAHMFPARMDDAGWKRLVSSVGQDDGRVEFWRELKVGYDAFERTHRLPKVRVATDGRYVVTPREK